MDDLKEFEALLHDVENRVDRLRALYEQYFQGIERLEPLIPKKEVERRIARLKKIPPRNTALRFRMQQLIQKYTTYQTYWMRVARQIEEGTYRRDVLRARQRREDAREERRAQRERESQAPQAWEIDIDVDVESEVSAALDDLSSRKSAAPRSPLAPPSGARPAPPSSAPPKRTSLSPFARPAKAGSSAPPRTPQPSAATFGKPRDPVAGPAARSFASPAGAKPPRVARPPGSAKAAAAQPPSVRRPAAPPSGESDGPDIKRVYDRYIEARRRNNERTDNVRYETMEKNIKKMMPKLKEKHRGKKIDFEVVVKDGKVGLKPVPK